jgi:phosphate/sulfate permease
MKTLIGGAVGAALGLIGLGFWWKEFLTVLGGTIPAVLLLGGGLAIYLGFDEMKDTWKKDEPVASAVTADELEKYKSEITDLKRELEGLKADKKPE